MKCKKIILSSLLVGVVALSSLSLFGCAKETSSANAYKLFNDTITSFKTDENGPLMEGEINAISTNFYIKDLKMSDKGYKTNKHEQYRSLTASGLNFIEKYYPKLKDNKIKADYSSLESSIKDLKKKYNTLKSEHSKFALIKDTSVDYTIYNGYFYKYKQSAESFIGSTYKCASALGKFLNDKAKLAKSVGTENMTAEAFNFYIDYNNLSIFEDYKVFFMDSCKGESINGAELPLFESIQNYYFANSYALESIEVNDDALAGISKEGLASVQKIYSSLKGSRGDARKAIGKFSVYNYATKYNQDIDAYKKANSFAAVYLNKILSYYDGEQSELFRTRQAVSNLFKA